MAAHSEQICDRGEDDVSVGNLISMTRRCTIADWHGSGRAGPGGTGRAWLGWARQPATLAGLRRCWVGGSRARGGPEVPDNPDRSDHLVFD